MEPDKWSAYYTNTLLQYHHYIYIYVSNTPIWHTLCERARARERERTTKSGLGCWWIVCTTTNCSKTVPVPWTRCPNCSSLTPGRRCRKKQSLHPSPGRGPGCPCGCHAAAASPRGSHPPSEAWAEQASSPQNRPRPRQPPAGLPAPSNRRTANRFQFLKLLSHILVQLICGEGLHV